MPALARLGNFVYAGNFKVQTLQSEHATPLSEQITVQQKLAEQSHTAGFDVSICICPFMLGTNSHPAAVVSLLTAEKCIDNILMLLKHDIQAWMQTRGDQGTAVFTADNVADTFGVVEGSYSAVPLPAMNVIQVCWLHWVLDHAANWSAVCIHAVCLCRTLFQYTVQLDCTHASSPGWHAFRILLLLSLWPRRMVISAVNMSAAYQCTVLTQITVDFL